MDTDGRPSTSLASCLCQRAVSAATLLFQPLHSLEARRPNASEFQLLPLLATGVGGWVVGGKLLGKDARFLFPLGSIWGDGPAQPSRGQC